MTQPNVVVLFPDQMRADFLGCYGSGLPTAHIDALASESCSFTNAVSAFPICVPARTALLTGMSGLATGVLDNSHALRPDARLAGISTWPEILSDASYYTAAIGKMHFYPWDSSHGFEYRVAAEDKRWLYVRDDYYKYLRNRGLDKYHGSDCPGYYETQGAVLSPLAWEDSVDHFVGSAACDFIEQYGREGPFALMVGFPGPHCPYDPSEEFLSRVTDDMLPPIIDGECLTPQVRARSVRANRGPWNGIDYETFIRENKLRIRRHYAASVLQIDHEIGRIVASLKATGLWSDTVVILASDHGDYLGDHDLIGKGSFYETAIRVPLLLRVPGTRPRVSGDLVELRDIAPTILGLAGCAVPGVMDARRLPADGEQARGVVIGATVDGWMARTERWKLTYYPNAEACLFDLLEDPFELVNRLGDPECLEIRDWLDEALRAEIRRGLSVAMQDREAAPHGTEQNAAFGRQGWTWDFPRPITGLPESRRV